MTKGSDRVWKRRYNCPFAMTDWNAKLLVQAEIMTG